MPLPRVDLRARRVRCAVRPGSEREPGFDAVRALAAPGRGRHLGPVRLRQPRSRRAAAVRGARRPAGDGRRQRPRPRRPPLPLPRPLGAAGQLEGRALENYLECYHCPVAHPGFSKVIDVDPDAYRLSVEGLRLEPGRARCREEARPRPRRHAPVPVPLPLAEHDDQHLAGPAERLDRALGAARPARRSRRPTTSSARMSPRSGSRSRSRSTPRSRPRTSRW